MSALDTSEIREDSVLFKAVSELIDQCDFAQETDGVCIQELYDNGYHAICTGDLVKAGALFEHMLHLDPMDFRGWFGIGLVAYEEGNLDQASTCADRADVLVDNHAELKFFKAEIALEQGNFAEACSLLNNALVLIEGKHSHPLKCEINRTLAKLSKKTPKVSA